MESGFEFLQNLTQITEIATNGVRLGVGATSILGDRDQDPPGADSMRPGNVLRLAVAEVNNLRQRAAGILGDSVEGARIGLRITHFIREHEVVEIVKQAVMLQQLAQGPARAENGVGDDGQFVFALDAFQGLADARKEIGFDFELHVLVQADQFGQLVFGKFPSQTLQQDPEPDAHGPGHILAVPDFAERGVGRVVATVNQFARDGGVAFEELLDELAPLD